MWCVVCLAAVFFFCGLQSLGSANDCLMPAPTRKRSLRLRQMPLCCDTASTSSIWLLWGPWSATCGTRTRRRSRCLIPDCTGIGSCSDLQWHIECDAPPPCCPVDATWGGWSLWSMWSATCGTRIQVRTRNCNMGTCGATANCTGQNQEFMNDASLPCCPVDASWMPWGNWSSWSTSCGNRTRIRVRICAGGSCGGVILCSGLVSQSQTGRDTSPPCCPVDAQWGAWSRSAWSATCGSRTRTKHRVCDGGSCNGVTTCSGMNTAAETDSNPPCCPVDAVWSSWASWTAWTASCGMRARKRKRSCSGASCGGLTSCLGNQFDSEKDSSVCCPVNAVWSLWTTWTAWTASCGMRARKRKRSCSGASCGGLTSCLGNQFDSEKDSSVCCPVDAVWSSWAAWTAWSATCGNRTRTRSRICKPAICGGLSTCLGVNTDVDSSVICCLIAGDWTVWMQWSAWSHSCGPRSRMRIRHCNTAFCGGKQTCVINQNDSESEQDAPPPCCSRDAAWSNWSSWSPEQATCGDTIQHRTRNCTGAMCGGSSSCPGQAIMSQVYKGSCCPVDASWTMFETWNPWTATCGSRTRSRSRRCKDAQCGGTPHCPGLQTKIETDSKQPSCYTPSETSSSSTVKMKSTPSLAASLRVSPSTSSVFPSVKQSGQDDNSSSSPVIYIAAGASAGFFFIVLIIVVCCCYVCRKCKSSYSSTSKDIAMKETNIHARHVKENDLYAGMGDAVVPDKHSNGNIYNYVPVSIAESALMKRHSQQLTTLPQNEYDTLNHSRSVGHQQSNDQYDVLQRGDEMPTYDHFQRLEASNPLAATAEYDVVDHNAHHRRSHIQQDNEYSSLKKEDRF